MNEVVVLFWRVRLHDLAQVRVSLCATLPCVTSYQIFKIEIFDVNVI